LKYRNELATKNYIKIIIRYDDIKGSQSPIVILNSDIPTSKFTEYKTPARQGGKEFLPPITSSNTNNLDMSYKSSQNSKKMEGGGKACFTGGGKAGFTHINNNTINNNPSIPISTPVDTGIETGNQNSLQAESDKFSYEKKSVSNDISQSRSNQTDGFKEKAKNQNQVKQPLNENILRKEYNQLCAISKNKNRFEDGFKNFCYLRNQGKTAKDICNAYKHFVSDNPERAARYFPNLANFLDPSRSDYIAAYLPRKHRSSQTKEQINNLLWSRFLRSDDEANDLHARVSVLCAKEIRAKLFSDGTATLTAAEHDFVHDANDKIQQRYDLWRTTQPEWKLLSETSND
jgi:hypothetical protein